MRRHLQPPWHVVHVIGSLSVGGAERQLVNYLLASDRRRFRHTVLCLSGPGELARELRGSGVEVVVHSFRKKSAMADLAGAVRRLRRTRVAILHAHLFLASFLGRLTALLAGVPVLIVTEHGKELWKNRAQVLVDRLLSKATCRHIAVSLDGKRIRETREKIPAAKIVHIPNGVRVDAECGNEVGRARIRAELGLRPDQPVAGTLGRLVAAKGYPYLLEALVKLRPRFPGLHWLMVGEGPEREPLRKLIAEAGMTGDVTITGSRSDTCDLLAAMDVFVMSSLREGLPVALLEAMAAGKAIVVTDVGGMPEAVTDRVCGRVVPAADSTLLAEAIADLLVDPQVAAQLGRHAHERAAGTYSIEVTARRIEEVYLECLAAKGLGGTAAPGRPGPSGSGDSS